MASQSPHLWSTSDDGTEMTANRLITIGTTTSPLALTVADRMGQKQYYSTALTSGTNYGSYIRMDASGAGVEAIAGRRKTLLTAASVGNAHGGHDTLELDTSAGNVTGLGTGLRGNVVVADRAVAAGTYYGVMAEIYPLGTTAALPAGSNACLCCSAPTATAMDDVVNAIAFSAADGTGHMIYTATDTHQTFVGSIRILVNGTARYLHFTDAQAGTS
jgi:hypothetical protein